MNLEGMLLRCKLRLAKSLFSRSHECFLTTRSKPALSYRTEKAPLDSLCGYTIVLPCEETGDVSLHTLCLMAKGLAETSCDVFGRCSLMMHYSTFSALCIVF